MCIRDSTRADFSYETSMMFSDGVIEKALMAIREGTEIVTDTNMAKSGISHKIAEKFGCSLNCYCLLYTSNEDNLNKLSVCRDKCCLSGNLSGTGWRH